MESTSLLAALLTAGVVGAAPAEAVEDIERRALDCAAVKSVVDYFTKYTSAASSL
jgi:hypothetical protein